MQYKILCIALLLMLLAVPTMAASTCTRCGGGTANASCCTIAVNYTFTGAAGTSALVTNVGTPSAVLLDFTIPQGAAGTGGGGTGIDYDAHIPHGVGRFNCRGNASDRWRVLQHFDNKNIHDN